MKKYIIFFSVLFLCGCSTINKVLRIDNNGMQFGCACHKLKNYLNTFDELDGQNLDLFIEVPNFCTTLESKINISTEPDISTLLSSLNINRSKSTKDGYDTYMELLKCAKSYNDMEKVYTALKSNVVNHFRTRWDELCPKVCRPLFKSVSYSDIETQFRAAYTTHFNDKYYGIASKIITASDKNAAFNNMANMIFDYYYKKDKARFESRTKMKLCNKDISDFLFGSGVKPEYECIYNNFKNFYVRIFSIAHDGVLIKLPEHVDSINSKIYFVYTKKDYATDENLRYGYYSYAGVHKYTTVMRTRNAVHSFKEYYGVEKNIEDLYFYKLYHDLRSSGKMQDWNPR